MNGTLQDQLVKEMRLAGINDLASANRFLDGKYLRAFHRQFARAAASVGPATRGVEPGAAAGDRAGRLAERDDKEQPTKGTFSRELNRGHF